MPLSGTKTRSGRSPHSELAGRLSAWEAEGARGKETHPWTTDGRKRLKRGGRDFEGMLEPDDDEGVCVKLNTVQVVQTDTPVAMAAAWDMDYYPSRRLLDHIGGRDLRNTPATHTHPCNLNIEPGTAACPGRPGLLAGEAAATIVREDLNKCSSMRWGYEACSPQPGEA